jgi:hypothetical protein
VRVLAAGDPRSRGRVDVLGIPGLTGKDQDAVAGRVRESDDEKLEIELDAPYDLRGWGGAPVVARDDGTVIGIVQAAQPDGRKMRVLATPIVAVLDGLRIPLEAGRGRNFAKLAPLDAPAEPPAIALPVATPNDAPVLQTGPQPPLEVSIEYPANEAIVGGSEASTFLAGRALAREGEGLKTDVIFVLDVSGSASWPSGVDVNGNGIVGTKPSGEGDGLYGLGTIDAGDSVLAAELAAVRRLSGRLDPRYTRVAVATFAGRILGYDVLDEDPALTRIGLTRDYAAVQQTLDRVLAPQPDGLTHMAAGVDQATRELTGARGALSELDPASQKIAIFLTDGVPSLPFPGDLLASTEAVLSAAKRAAAAGVRVFTFGIGELALRFPLALYDLARVTGGIFTPVRDPASLSEVFSAVNLAGVEEVTVRNTTLDEAARAVDLGPDGSFGALVPLRTGRNVIEVEARAAGGRSRTERITVHFAPDAPTIETPPGLLPIQNKLLELRLTNMRRERIDAEQRRDEATRKQLELEIERERAIAAERANEQRKELELKIEKGGGSEPSPAP